MNRKLYILLLLLLIAQMSLGQFSGKGPVRLSLPSNSTAIKWYKNGVWVADSTATTFTTSVSGTYNATYIENTVSCDIIQSDYFVLLSGSNSITLDGQANNGGGTGYQWANGGVDIVGAVTANYTTNVGGLYTLKYNNGTCDLTTTPYYVFVLCNAGTVAPTLSSSAVNNVCPATTIDLSTITATNLPSGALLTWHSGTPATTSNKVNSITSLPAGTYYAAFYDSSNDCYSGTSGSATTAVAGSIIDCCKAGTVAPVPRY